MPTFLDGQYNLAALQVPGVYVDIIPPSPLLLGVPSNIEGLVGVGSWGPLNAPIPGSKPADVAVNLGPPINRKYDIATWVWAATQVGGAVGFYMVRVSDGTDTAAAITAPATCLTLTGKYTGILGNLIKWSVATGSKPNTKMIIISFPGRSPEIFNNIPGSANAFWVAAAAAINNGNETRGPSQVVVASAGAGTTEATLGTQYSLTGGTDGAGIADSDLMGQDTIPRKGMYALRSTGCDGFGLVDHSTATDWAAMDEFGLSENMMPVEATASGDTIASAAAARVSNGLDDFPFWLITGDYPRFYDSQNAISRLVSPAAFALGWAGNASPEQSPLNKPLRGISSTQRTETGQTYSDTELQAAELGGIDLIVGPPTTPGGNYYTFITGRNASSNTGGNGIEYTRLTFFLARSIQSKAAGSFVGKLQSIRPNDKTRSDAKALLDGFFAQLADPASGSNGYGMIDQWSVQCDLNNNPPNLQARGYLFAYCMVRYLNVVRYFVVKLAGGGNVQVTSQSTPPSPAQFQ